MLTVAEWREKEWSSSSSSGGLEKRERREKKGRRKRNLIESIDFAAGASPFLSLRAVASGSRRAHELVEEGTRVQCWGRQGEGSGQIGGRWKRKELRGVEEVVEGRLASFDLLVLETSTSTSHFFFLVFSFSLSKPAPPTPSNRFARSTPAPLASSSSAPTAPRASRWPSSSSSEGTR